MKCRAKAEISYNRFVLLYNIKNEQRLKLDMLKKKSYQFKHYLI